MNPLLCLSALSAFSQSALGAGIFIDKKDANSFITNRQKRSGGKMTETEFEAAKAEYVPEALDFELCNNPYHLQASGIGEYNENNKCFDAIYSEIDYIKPITCTPEDTDLDWTISEEGFIKSDVRTAYSSGNPMCWYVRHGSWRKFANLYWRECPTSGNKAARKNFKFEQRNDGIYHYHTGRKLYAHTYYDRMFFGIDMVKSSFTLELAEEI